MNTATSTLNELQKAAGSLGGVADALSKAKQSRGEKKARKVARETERTKLTVSIFFPVGDDEAGAEELLGDRSGDGAQGEEHSVRHRQTGRLQEPGVRHLHRLRGDKGELAVVGS